MSPASRGGMDKFVLHMQHRFVHRSIAEMRLHRTCSGYVERLAGADSPYLALPPDLAKDRSPR